MSVCACGRPLIGPGGCPSCCWLLAPGPPSLRGDQESWTGSRELVQSPHPCSPLPVLLLLLSFSFINGWALAGLLFSMSWWMPPRRPSPEMTSHVPMLSSGPAVPTRPHPFVLASLGGAGWVEPRNRVLGGQQASVKCLGLSLVWWGEEVCCVCQSYKNPGQLCPHWAWCLTICHLAAAIMKPLVYAGACTWYVHFGSFYLQFSEECGILTLLL